MGSMHNTPTITRVPAALLLLLLLPATAMLISLASAARSNTPTPPPSAPLVPATDVELLEVSIVAGVLVKKVVASSSKAPGAATSGGGSRPLPGSLVSRRGLAARKVIPPSGPSEGGNSYSFQPPPA
uniref:Uncharacterized protein n=1 Tax=Setaria viridis TaxID=4556 RepID=A0A4U6V8F6_SETVI|nr:hypothetical protein SEVIR_3G060950v2 [Setaria viridis]